MTTSNFNDMPIFDVVVKYVRNTLRSASGLPGYKCDPNLPILLEDPVDHFGGSSPVVTHDM